MPCDSGYMKPNNKEVELSKVVCLLEELEGKKWKKSHWEGNHPDIYYKNISDEKADELVSELCSKLQKVNVKKYSLEMQMWWRDHQKADKKRIKAELKQAKTEKDRAVALSKLTPYERKLLELE